MAEPRKVTCHECGFQVEDRGRLDWPKFTGDVRAYSTLCTRLDEAPDPPGNYFYCIALRTAAKRAAVEAEIKTSRT